MAWLTDWPRVVGVSGWVLAGAGLVLALWALVGDRARGRRRCPRCWYSMEGAPSLVCPECGRDARRERRLLKTRRRWGLVVIGALLLCQLPFARRASDAHTHGWKAIVPTSVLVLFVPVKLSAWQTYHMFGTTHLAEPSNAWLMEFQRRVDNEDVAAWQWSWFFDRLFKQTPEAANAIVRTRDVWPNDAPIAAELWYPSILFRQRPSLSTSVRLKGTTGWVDRPWRDEFMDLTRNFQLGRPQEGQTSAAIELRMVLAGREIWRGTIRRVAIGGPADIVLKPISGPRADDAVRGVIKGLVASSAGNLYLAYDRRGEHIGEEPEDWALGFRCEAIRDGTLVATGELLYPMVDKYTSISDVDGTDYVMLTPVPGVEPVERVGHWTLRITGDAKIAVGDYGREYYWSGTVESDYGAAALENGEPRHIPGG